MLDIEDLEELITLDSISKDESKFKKFRKNADDISRMLVNSQYTTIKDYGHRISSCANYLKFSQCYEGLKLIDANFCRVRVCPICQWRRSLKYRAIYFKHIERMKAATTNWQLLTLTVKNPHINELDNTIKQMERAFTRIFRADRVESLLNDKPHWIKCLEVNAGKKNKNHCHPHFHILLGFKKGHYIDQSRWALMWKEKLEVNYMPIVDIRQIKQPLTNKSMCEVLKYISKATDLIESGPRWTESYIIQMDGKHCIRSSNFFKNKHNQEANQKTENLINVGDRQTKIEIPGLDHLEFTYNKPLKTYTLIQNKIL